MTSQLDSHTTTDVKPEMLSGVQTGYRIPHDNFHAKMAGAKLYIFIGVDATF